MNLYRANRIMDYMFNALIVVIVLLLMIYLVAGIKYVSTTSSKLAACVKSKEISVSNRHSIYLIFTETEVFSVEDSLLNGRFDSSDMYNQIEVGKCYQLEKLQGFREPLFSWYRNIINLKEIN